MPRRAPFLLLAATLFATLAPVARECHAVTPPSRPEKPACDRDPPPTTWAAGTPEQEAAFERARRDMVLEQLHARDISDPRVLVAMGMVPRHRFVRPGLRSSAYADHPLPHGCEQTVSQPYIVALMTQAARPRKGARALDVGTGSGYQAAVLAELVDHVYSVEIVCPLADTARDRLRDLGVKNVTVRCGDGWSGWSEHAPYDVIVVAAAPAEIPPALLEQLAPGGHLVIPVGRGVQELMVVHKHRDGRLERTKLAPVRFVPMTR